MGYSLQTQPVTRSNPKFAKTLIGEFTFDQERDLYRDRLFLQRNMTRVLAYHEKTKKKVDNTTKHTQITRSATALAVSKTPLNVDPAVPNTEPADILNAAAQNLSTASLGISKVFDTSIPAPDAVSSSTLMAQTRNGNYQAPARRSLRRVEEIYHEDEAELAVNLCNIRKKLNFKTNLPPEDERPRKKIKRDWIKCQCHLTIWDNRRESGDEEPLVRKSQMGQVVSSENGSNGYCVDIEIDQPFIVKASELKVKQDRGDKSVFGIIENYFMEVKIIPSKTDCEWPPIPILGKSDGDHFIGLARTVSEKLQGALVARYMHLPQAPASDVSLSVFFLHEGRTYRSKYGLEVAAEWARPGTFSKRIKQEVVDTTLDSWMLDPVGQMFGRKEVINGTATEKPHKPTKPSPEPSVKISYTFDATLSQSALKEFRTATLTGYCCPACPSIKAINVDALQFHFLNCHHKYKFILDGEVRDPKSHNLISTSFRVSQAEVIRPRKQELDNEDEQWTWQKPTAPLDLQAYIKGDKSWIGEVSKKRGPANVNSTAMVHDPVSLLRKEHDGFLPAQYVRDFRLPQRKKYPIIHLMRRTDDKRSTYTSLSHRQTSVDEGARSETDDEIDDEWFIQRHLEELDVIARKDGWSDMKRELRKRWDRHRLEEKLEHPRYLSDSLIRFVRKEKKWLRNKDKSLQIAFAQLLQNMKKSRVINDAICADIYRMLFEDSWNDAKKPKTVVGGGVNGTVTAAVVNGITRDIAMTDALPFSQNRTHSMSSPAYNGRTPPTRPTLLTYAQTQLIQQRNALLALPPGHCGICTKPIQNIIKEVVYCNNPTCDTPGVSYHMQCTKTIPSEKMSWSCEGCREQSKAIKGKVRAFD